MPEPLTKRALIALLPVCWLVLVGCSPAEPKAGVVIINGPDPETLDPALGTGIEDLRIISALSEGLTRNDPDTSRAIPGLAESWEISPDGLVYTFHLRDHLQWGPNDPIAADDIVYSWLRALAPETASEYAGQLYYIKNGEAYNSGKLKDATQVGVKALDARTLRIELNHPTAFFLELCAFQTLAVVPRKVIDRYGEDWMRAKPLPTSGPYLLGAWRLNDKIRLVKNPYYWDAANTRTEIIDCLPISTPSTALNLYQTGAADIIWDQDNIPSELLDVLSKRPDYHTFPYIGTYFLRFNVTRPPFNDARVRKALALTIDKKRLVENFLRGGEPIADHLVPDGTANYEGTKGLEYDPAQAKRLLAEAGFPDGKGFPHCSYLFDAAAGGGQIHSKVAVELQQMWQQQLGIHIELRQMEKRSYMVSQNNLDYDVSRSTWIGDYNDPNTFLDLFRSDNGNNRTGWKNARYDALLNEGNSQVDLKKRAELLKQAETILVHDDAPIVPIYFYVGFNYYNPARIKGVYPNILDVHPLNAIWKVADTKPN